MAGPVQPTPTGLWPASGKKPPKQVGTKPRKVAVLREGLGSTSPVPIPRGQSEKSKTLPPLRRTKTLSLLPKERPPDSPPEEITTPPADKLSPKFITDKVARSQTFSGKGSKPPQAAGSVGSSVPASIARRGQWRARPKMSEVTFAPPPEPAVSQSSSVSSSPISRSVSSRRLSPPSVTIEALTPPLAAAPLALPQPAQETDDQRRERVLRLIEERRQAMAAEIAARLAAEQQRMPPALPPEEKKEGSDVFRVTPSRRASIEGRFISGYMPKDVHVSASGAQMVREALAWARANSGDLREGIELSADSPIEPMPTLADSQNRVDLPMLASALQASQRLENLCQGMEGLLERPLSETESEPLDLPAMVPPPRDLEETDDLFSMSKIAKLFSNKTVPSGGSLEAMSERLGEFTGLSWSGPVIDSAVLAFAKLFPATKCIRLYDCTDLSNVGILGLRQYTEAEVLLLGKIPATAKLMDLLFTPVSEKPWQKLKELSLAGLPVTNKALQRIAELPLLETVDLSYCANISWQGLRHLLQCQNLHTIRIDGCRRIDPFACDEFRSARPDVQIEGNTPPCDAQLIAMAIEEAKLSDGPSAPRYYAFLTDRLIPESELPTLQLDEAATSAAYTQKLAEFGIQLSDLGIVQMGKEHWMKADQVLQAIKNITRTFHAIVVYLKDEVGFFTDQDRGMVEPVTIGQLISYLRRPPLLKLPKSEEKEADLEEIRESQLRSNSLDPPPAHKMKILPFAHLGLTWIPSYVLQTDFSRVTAVDLEGNPISEIPLSFRANLPNLGKEPVAAAALPSPPANLSKLVLPAAPPPQPPPGRGAMDVLRGLFRKG